MNGQMECVAMLSVRGNAPFALQQVEVPHTIIPNATAIPVDGSLCGEGSCYQQGPLLFLGLAPRARQTIAIDALDHTLSGHSIHIFFSG